LDRNLVRLYETGPKIPKVVKRESDTTQNHSHLRGFHACVVLTALLTIVQNICIFQGETYKHSKTGVFKRRYVCPGGQSIQNVEKYAKDGVKDSRKQQRAEPRKDRKFFGTLYDFLSVDLLDCQRGRNNTQGMCLSPYGST
jgi:hypothetical protein